MILLDVGVWLAAIWGRHAHHPATADWFGRQTGDLVFCRVTQMSLFRLLSNPAIMGDDAVDRSQAWRTFDQLWADERVLWADEPDELDAVWRAISARDDKSHKLWTDDYLAAFAQASGATLATLDTEFPTRYPSVRVESLLPLPIPQRRGLNGLPVVARRPRPRRSAATARTGRSSARRDVARPRYVLPAHRFRPRCTLSEISAL